MQRIRGPGIKRVAVDGIPGLKLPCAEIEFSQAIV